VGANIAAYDFVTAGKRAREFIARTGGNLVGDFSAELSDTVTPKEAKKVSRFLQSLYRDGGYSSVRVVYSHFISAINQKATTKSLFPMSTDEIAAFLALVYSKSGGTPELSTANNLEYTYEPSRSVVAMESLPMIYDLVTFEAFLEAKASEHASRMVAMKNAKDSANKKVKGLTLTFNKARQSAITKEVSEIVSGVESMKDSA
jgi:F-type H+-transporting ATPase subunit gamma